MNTALHMDWNQVKAGNLMNGGTKLTADGLAFYSRYECRIPKKYNLKKFSIPKMYFLATDCLVTDMNILLNK